MTLNNAEILALENRIGFGKPYNLPSDITVDNQHIEGTSGRTFGYFHRLVTLENIYKTSNKIEMSSEEFNEMIAQIKKDTVLSVISHIDRGIAIECRKRLTKHLEDNPGLFDEVIGYTLAITAIELMLSSTRINKGERNALFRYETLKIDLEGWRDENGKVITGGLRGKLTEVIRAAIQYICPNEFRMPIIENANCW